MIAFAWIGFIALILIGLPVAFCLGISAVTMLALESTTTNMAIATKIVMGMDSFTLLSIPFFMIAGNIMTSTGVGEKIFDFASTCVQHLDGGLAQVNVLASMISAGMSGTAVNDIASIGALEVRAMEKAGFPRPFSGAVTAASSSIGPIIPPSVPLVLIGSIMGASVSRILLAGLIPGILMGVALMLYIALVSKKRHYPKMEPAPWGVRWKAFVKAIPALLMPVILMSGFMTGFVTPTESAALAVLYAIFLGLGFYRNVSIKQFWQCIKNTAQLCSTTMFIIACASVFGMIITQHQIPQKLTAFMLSLTDNKYIIILMIIVILLILGCLLETTAIFIIMTPILVVPMQAIGMDLVQFAVMEALIVTIGLYTPPVGVGMFLTCKVCQIKSSSFIKDIWPMLLMLLLAGLLVAYVPAISIGLPNLVFGA